MSNTFYWHDYETWGINPALDRPAQFAGVRTDEHLNIIGEPLVIYNQPPLDRLPHPQACAITGITPQYALEHGVAEPEFCAQIYQQINQASTCSVGYNSLRFDDEVTRHLLYRNFYPVYDREWKQGNSRWDLIDVMRLCYALRPEEINWPNNEEGFVSFKLEALSQANNLVHEQAHDALSDVYATIALAKLLKNKKPKLFDYALSLRDKRNVSQHIDISNRKPLLYISSYFSAAQANASLVMPLALHPTNKNAVIVLDLRQSPDIFLKSQTQQVIDNLFLAHDKRTFAIPLMTLQINRSPMLAAAKLVDEKVAAHIHLNLSTCWKHYQNVLDFDRSLLDMKLTAIYSSANELLQSTLAEEQLYSGGFFRDADIAQLGEVCMADAQAWQGGRVASFQDARLNVLQQQYQARYFPNSLDARSKKEWLDYCLQNISKPQSSKELSIDTYLQALDEIDVSKGAIIQALRDWPAQREQILIKQYS